MKLKPGVSIVGLKIEMRFALKTVDRLWWHYGQEAVVTAGTNVVDDNGKFIHSPASFHPFGYALDFRTRYFDQNTIDIIATKLRELLGDDYTVVVHSTHIHIQYNKS